MPRCHAAILTALLLQGLTLHANLPTAAYRTPSSWSRHTKDIACELLETGSSPRMVETYRASDRLTLKYDYMGLRVEKCVYSGEALARMTLYVYDGFKCVEELDGLAGNAVLRRHAWQPFDVGLDVILATTDAAGTSFFLHDANKNVMQKTDAEGDLLEKYEYAPFGGNAGEASAGVGFSSEAFDSSTNSNYYNYRYYAPCIGRWTKRDPIGEKDCLNLLLHCRNSPLCNTDHLGLACCNGSKYNIFTHCCCRGRILKRGKKPSGIKICKAVISNKGEGGINRSSNSILGFSHYWIEIGNTSIHFSGGDDQKYLFAGEAGQVTINQGIDYLNDTYVNLQESYFFKGRGKTCFEYEINPCQASIRLVRRLILIRANAYKTNPPYYDLILNNCQSFVQELVENAINDVSSANLCGP